MNNDEIKIRCIELALRHQANFSRFTVPQLSQELYRIFRNIEDFKPADTNPPVEALLSIFEK